MRLIRLSLIGLYLFLGLALFCLSISFARSADGVVDNSGQSSSTSSSFSTSDIVPAMQVLKYKIHHCVIQDVDNRNTLEGCLQIIKDFLRQTVINPTNNTVVSDPSSEMTAAWSAVYMPSQLVYLSNVSYRSLNDGFLYSKEVYIVGESFASYKCPSDDNPDYSLPTSKPDEPNSEGKYCKKPEPENPCSKLKGLNDSLQVTKYFVDKTGGSPACKDGCEMTRVAGNAWEYWTDENKVTWAVASYVYSGNECSDDYNYREVQSAETPSSGQSTVPSSAASSAEPTAPSSATSSDGGTGTNPSSGSGTNTNPSGGSGTGNDPSCYGTNQGDVCNGDSGSTGSGGGAGADDGSGTPPASSATPASGGEGTFNAPKGSKDYLKDVFSSDAIKSVQSQRDATLTKINEKMAQIKALTNINSISVSGDISPDVKSVRGNDVDFSGKDIISKFSISWVFYFVTALFCMDIILNRRKK